MSKAAILKKLLSSGVQGLDVIMNRAGTSDYYDFFQTIREKYSVIKEFGLLVDNLSPAMLKDIVVIELELDELKRLRLCREFLNQYDEVKTDIASFLLFSTLEKALKKRFESLGKKPSHNGRTGLIAMINKGKDIEILTVSDCQSLKNAVKDIRNKSFHGESYNRDTFKNHIDFIESFIKKLIQFNHS
ncbi:MAG: hypothetical protein HRT88_20165 [Lentisphaeraceae bacterium]|nr:hypothetical protein [Lentisphaeraceae bacterium]